MNRLLVIFFVWVGISDLQAQQDIVPITWATLTDVSYLTIFDEEAGYVYMKPRFGDKLKSLNGKMIAIKGYIMPMDTEGKQYALSAFPYSACFFCGGASKESVMELWLADGNRQYKLDDVVLFKGKLHLNEEQFGLNYLLKDAQPVK